MKQKLPEKNDYTVQTQPTHTYLFIVDDSYHLNIWSVINLIKLLVICTTNDPCLVQLFGLWTPCSWAIVTKCKGDRSWSAGLVASILLGNVTRSLKEAVAGLLVWLLVFSWAMLPGR